MSDEHLETVLRGLPQGSSALLSGLIAKVVEGVRHPVALYGKGGMLIAMNPAYREMHGISQGCSPVDYSECEQRFEAFSLDGKPLPREEWPLPRALRGESVDALELNVRRSDTGAAWKGRYTANPVHDDAGEICLVVVSAEDTTESRHLAEALQQSEMRIRSIGDANIIGIVSGDIYGRVTEANDEFLRIIGYTREDLGEGRIRWDQITPSEHLANDAHAIAEAQISGACHPFKKEYIHRDGHRVPVLVGFALSGEKRDLSTAFIIDLSMQRGVEDALMRSEERYRSLIAATTSIVWITGPTGEFTEPQRAWEHHTGQPWEEHRGFGWKEMIHEDDRDRVGAEWQHAVETPTRCHILGRVWHAATQQHRHFEARAVPIFEPDGSVREWVGTVVDAHEHRLAQEAEREARREAEAANSAKDEFLAVLSHELRTPLTPAFLSIDELMENPHLPEYVRNELTLVRRNLGHETKLIDDLLDMTRIQSGKLELRLEVVNLHDVLRDTARDCMGDCRRKNLDLKLDLRATRNHVQGDPVRLRQVFWNLLRNAVKFTPAGGFVELRSASTEAGIEVSVQDSGIGIPAEMLPRLFARFEQGGAEVTKRFGGLGLGLAITKSLVDLHEATLLAESPGPGHGACFRVSLPCVAPVDYPERSGLTALQPPQGGVRILLVEDHDDTRITLVRLLKRQGHDVLSAGSLHAALIVARARDFDLLISDIGLPDGSGLDLLQQLPPETRAISLSGFGMEKDVAASKEAGFIAHLTKPVDFERLNALIRETARRERA